jgi:hypothetical protein
VGLTVVVTSIGGVALTDGSSNAGKLQSIGAPGHDPDLAQFLPGQIRIVKTRWAHLLGSGPAQFVVSYRTRFATETRALVLAWRRVNRKWQKVYDGVQPNGPQLATDVLQPSSSAVEWQFASGLIDAVNKDSNGRYDIPSSAANIALIEEWMAHEGGLWANNPLNTSLYASRYPHEFTSSGVDVGIPIYPNLDVGIADTAATLLGNPAYQQILAVLESGSGSCMAFASAVVESPWAASHYGYDPGSFCPPGSPATVSAELAQATASSGKSQSTTDRSVSARTRHGHSGHSKSLTSPNKKRTFQMSRTNEPAPRRTPSDKRERHLLKKASHG